MQSVFPSGLVTVLTFGTVARGVKILLRRSKQRASRQKNSNSVQSRSSSTSVGPLEGADALFCSTAISVPVCPEEVDLVIFHAPCADGFASAHAAWLRLGSKAQYIGMSHSSATKDPPDVTGRVVAVCDFSFNLQTTNKMLRDAKQLIILDHHASAQEVLQDISNDNKVGSFEAFQPWTCRLMCWCVRRCSK
jgi:hypothetical protein